MPREILSDHVALEFADLAREYIVNHVGSHNKRPDFVLGFSRELEMDLHSANLAFAEAERKHTEELVNVGYRFHVRY
ncbi:MAG: hypothetical protein AABX35_02070 [Nanoarchaeota archaeon]